MPEQFLDVQTTGDVVLVKLTVTHLDDSNAQEFGQQLSAVVEQPGCHDLHLDLDGVQYLGSMGLAKVLVLHRKVQAGGGRLRLLNVNDQVYDTFAVTKLNTLLDVRRKAAG